MKRDCESYYNLITQVTKSMPLKRKEFCTGKEMISSQTAVRRAYCPFALRGDFMGMKALEDGAELLAEAGEYQADGMASHLPNHQRCRHVLHDYCKTNIVMMKGVNV